MGVRESGSVSQARAIGAPEHSTSPKRPSPVSSVRSTDGDGVGDELGATCAKTAPRRAGRIRKVLPNIILFCNLFIIFLIKKKYEGTVMGNRKQQ